MRLGNVFRAAADILEDRSAKMLGGEEYCSAYCCISIQIAAITEDVSNVATDMFEDLFLERRGDGSVPMFWWGSLLNRSQDEIIERQTARLIALDLAALIADEGEFKREEYGRAS